MTMIAGRVLDATSLPIEAMSFFRDRQRRSERSTRLQLSQYP